MNYAYAQAIVVSVAVSLVIVFVAWPVIHAMKNARLHHTGRPGMHYIVERPEKNVTFIRPTPIPQPHDPVVEVCLRNADKATPTPAVEIRQITNVKWWL